MIHGIKNSFLYSAKKISVQCSRGAETANFQGTGFFVITANSQSFLVTNRHVVDPGYSDPKFKGFVMDRLAIESHIVPPKLNLENFNKANKGFRQVGWLAQ
ncbi:hypothetical protein [Fibrobacter sp. UWS1]|uniref:hypothetical protein n=1 Tax=Fibrobacter sp. UWS1 TaxID=1896220 RepID=UPI000BB13A20|nr:hypothetical protein [Fibrobacter sp. UWS1]